jgi:hypothetical protein
MSAELQHGQSKVSALFDKVFSEGRPNLTAPRLFTSTLVWERDRAHIAAEDPLCFSSAGPPAPGKSSQTVGDNGCARHPA